MTLLSLLLTCLVLASIIPVSLLAFQLLHSIAKAGSIPALGLPVAAYWLFRTLKQERGQRRRRPPYYLQ